MIETLADNNMLHKKYEVHWARKKGNQDKKGRNSLWAIRVRYQNLMESTDDATFALRQEHTHHWARLAIKPSTLTIVDYGISQMRISKHLLHLMHDLEKGNT